MKKILFLSVFTIAVIALFSIIDIDKVAYAATSLPDGSSCVSSSECQSEFCYFTNAYLAGICCRSYQFCCGNNSCDSEETCSSCPADCGSCGPVCGNGSCESGETCSNCSSDCGACKKSNGSSCYSNSECSSSYCVHMVCRASSVYCGDAHCDSGESCSSCSSDCGSCGPVCGNGSCESGESNSSCPSDCISYKSPNGSFCSSASECTGGYCVNQYCRSSAVSCGDGLCNGNETCSSCSYDCGGCSAEPESNIPAKKSDGTYCSSNSECFSNNCHNNRCCVSGKDCCFEDNNCSSNQYCSLEEGRYYCMPGLELGRYCTANRQCQSRKCEKNICCSGDKCCQNHDQCGNNEYCDTGGYYCRYKWNVGENCDIHEMCKTGYCDTYTRKCAEKPPESAAPEAVSEVPAEAEIEFTNLPPDIKIKKNEEYHVSIVIKNKSQKEVILAEMVEVDNQIPFIVDISSKSLRVPAKKIKLLPGEAVDNETNDILEALESLVLTGKNGGSGEIKLKAVYFVNNRVKIVEDKIFVTVASENVEKEPAASSKFNKQMVMVEKKITKDLATGETKEVIFVEPEDKEIYQATVNAWEKAQDQMDEAVQDLKDDFTGQITGGIKPDAVAFFETIKQLNEATTQKEISETALRALAPPTMAVGFDLANLVDAIDKKQKEEKAFANHFGIHEFKTLPIYDKDGKLIGNSKAILTKWGETVYAIKIGDL